MEGAIVPGQFNGFRNCTVPLSPLLYSMYPDACQRLEELVLCMPSLKNAPVKPVVS